jgi:hypothetical protein
MADVAEFGMIGSHKLEDDAIGPVNQEALYFVMLWMQLLHVE